MRPVAVGEACRVLATAKVNRLRFFGGKDRRCDPGARMAAIAKGLRRAAPAGTPRVLLAGFDFDGVRIFLGDNGFCHDSLLPDGLQQRLPNVVWLLWCGFIGGDTSVPASDVTREAMAVYTDITDEQVNAFVADYEIGNVIACKGIAEGIENSNFLLVTDRDTFILTLYEKRVRTDDLPFFIALMEHLAQRGIPCPTPVRARDGDALRTLAERKAAIVTFLRGMWPRRPTADNCRRVGEAMARLHLAGADFAMHRANDLSVGGWRPLYELSTSPGGAVDPRLAADIEAELAFLESEWPTDLPSGVIHADLFPDNVFFDQEHLSGLIDFYFACCDFLAYDVAVCLNAWCFEVDGSFNVTKARRLLDGYQSVRRLESAEIAALPLLARGAAVRFLLTRLYDWLNTPKDAFVTPKDPQEYVRKLRFHQQVRDVGAYGLDVVDEL